MMNPNSKKTISGTTPSELTAAELQQLAADKDSITVEELFGAWSIAGEVSTDYTKLLEMESRTLGKDPSLCEVMPLGMAIHYGAVMYVLGAKQNSGM